jgi:rRNA-processing protein FCF1
MEILLDTNFILTCVRQKIDFFRAGDEIIDEKIRWIVAEEVLKELRDLSRRKGGKIKDKQAAKLGAEIAEKLKKIKLNNKNVDKGIVDYLSKHKKTVLATLDRELKKKISNKVLTIRAKKFLDII